MNTLDALIEKHVYGLADNEFVASRKGARLRYSIDIEAAFDVLAKVTQPDKYEPTIAKIEGPFADGWGVTFSWLHHDGDIDDERQGGSTLPIAICRAALARVGVPQSEIDAAMEDGTA